MRSAYSQATVAALICAATVSMTSPVLGNAEDALLAASCSGCHARDADSTVPNIYGRTSKDVQDALLGFRSERRPATVMTRIAKGYSEDEIKRIAVYLATIRPGSSN